MLVSEHIAEGAPEPKDDWSTISNRPGLEIAVDEKAHGGPLFSMT